MPKRKKTNQKDRLQQYKDLVWTLRMATRITLNQELAVETVNKLVNLHCQFEGEDYPNEGH